MTQTEFRPASLETIRRAIGPDKTVVFVSGNFNIIHPGHLRLLKFASEAGDYLVVGVQPDSNPGVTVPAEMRLECLQSNSHIDFAFIMEYSISDVVARLRPDIVVKGKEFLDRHNPEKPIVESYGGKIIFGSGEVRFSSIQLLQREYFQAALSNISKPKDFPARRNFEVEALKQVIAGFSGLRVLVIGDLIIDTYVDCEPIGMSQEEPTIVVSPLKEKAFVGGAGIVALHASGLGADVNFITVVGDDARARFAAEQFCRFEAKAEMIVDSTRPTTNKTRYRANGKSLLRINDMRQHAIEPLLIEQVLASVDRLLPRTDLLLFSDFNYGCLPQPLVDAVVERAKARGIMMMADSQASSQISDISRYRGMTLITPTEREARLAVQDFESGLVIVAERLKNISKAHHIMVTLGWEGTLIYGHDQGETQTDRLPAFNTAPKDVAGAGDSLFTCSSLALACGVDIWRSAYLGSLAAACQVARVGNTPLTTTDLLTEIGLPDFYV